ncbi:hypothetical protein [uncultured Bacteroides sp.]|uniref:hypothetical protein n=1 Tax=uncultured Bacteroides sp. TaxID=162156 RepID=UPI002597072B|nr:hypothetical protein [uncultured Bacteroides sp.]
MIQTAQRLRNHTGCVRQASHSLRYFTGMVRGCDFFLLREEGEEERRVAAVLRRGFMEVLVAMSKSKERAE